ncbi:MAG: VOC family protein [Acidobacteria bacterium]|nr:MAG: VOC family protein [Acidobacteriota bacterium]
MQLNPYLQFNGQCGDAFKFYEHCLGGKIAFKMTFGESPAAKETPPDRHNQIMHVSLMVGDKALMGSDAPPEYYEKPQGFSVTLGVDSAAEAERIFSALAEKGTIRMPLSETFWAQRFGMLVDQFGIPWMINCERSE